MRNHLRFDALVLGVLLGVGASACSPERPRDANAGHACHSEFSTVGGTQAECCGGRIGVAEAQRRSERSEPRGLTRRRRFAVAHTGCRPCVRRSVALSVGCRGRARPAGVLLMLTAPAPGETLSAGSVTVSVSYTGPPLVAAANATQLDDYHLHYFLDVDPTPYIGSTQPIPLGDPRIIHSGATSVTFDNVAAR